MIVLRGWNRQEGELEQFFTLNERATAIAIGRLWHQKGWNPRLLVKSYSGRFSWLTSQQGQKRAA